MEHGKAAHVWVVFAVASYDLCGDCTDDEKCAQSGGADDPVVRRKDSGDHADPVKRLRDGIHIMGRIKNIREVGSSW